MIILTRSTRSIPIVGSDEIDRLAKRFMKLDKDNSGAIDKDEFLSIPGIGQNPLAKRVIDIFDENKGGDIDFKEFVTGLSTFSSSGSSYPESFLF